VPTRILALVTAVALATAPTTAAASAPSTDAAAQRGPVHAELVIEVELGEGSAVIADRVRKRADELLRKREVQPSRGAQDPRLVVRITPVSGTPGYDCSVSLHDTKGPIPNTELTTACNMCTEGELIDHVEKAIDGVIPQIPVETAPPPDPKVDPDTTPTTTAITPDTEPRDRSLTPIGKAGIGVAALGLAGAVAGAVVMTRPTKEVDDELETDRTEYRVPGIAVLAGGLGVLVVGIALIAVDRARVKKRGNQTASSGLRRLGRFGVLRF
jgi:hypothetical protein